MNLTLIPTKVDNIFQRYVTLLKQNRVPVEELVFTKRLSKDSNEYQEIRDTIENSALCLLKVKANRSKPERF